MDASEYVMGLVMMLGGNTIWYDYEMFHGGVLNSPTHAKELYALPQDAKKWKHYLMGNKIFIHTDH